VPVLLDIPGVFMAGSAIALASRDRILADQVTGASRHVRSALILGIFYGLSIVFLCFFREDWMWHYLMVPPLPTMIWYLIFWALLAISAWLGAWLTQSAIADGRMRRAWAYLSASVGVLVTVWLLTLRAYRYVGTYAEYHAGEAFTLDMMPETYRVIFISIATIAAVVTGIVVVNIHLDRKAAKERSWPVS
jgi:hypothetical protein